MLRLQVKAMPDTFLPPPTVSTRLGLRGLALRLHLLGCCPQLLQLRKLLLEASARGWHALVLEAPVGEESESSDTRELLLAF